MTSSAPTRRERPREKTREKNREQSSVASFLAPVRQWMETQPTLDYLMIRIVVFALTAIGVVMVFSSSMTWSVIEGDSVWGSALRQCVLVALGLILMWCCLVTRLSFIRRLAPILLGISILLLVLVLIPGIGTGLEDFGSQSWIVLGPLRLQPSEVARVTIAIWGAHYLAGAGYSPDERRKRIFVFGGVGVLMGVLIFAERDFGMAVSFAVVVLALLFFVGVQRSFFVGVVALAVLTVGVILLGGGYRSQRIHVYLDALVGNFDDTRSNAYQSHQGFLSLADGGALGVGIGQSRAKWFYLPEAKNDFIFAIIGEELGLWGGAMVILLFGLLGYFGLRVARRSQNDFHALMAATLTAGVVVQAFVNIGYVIGVVPVTGIQLPLISAGGTSAIITLASMGLLASCARHEPEAVSSMQNYGRPFFDRLLRIREPLAEGPVVRPREQRGEERERARGDAPRGSQSSRPRPVTRRRRPSSAGGSVRTERPTERYRDPRGRR
ncbi:putative lipid II flippase FtsW [Corynebacterium uropygiale]|uniref:Probable peptidoglycan glycosyltransferase FtsW n=1 Tax=Corynebacterium uropygiale TaxID=1775911 RepID=A0A9X1QRL6_9CORY|nr:putative peptidoglycan glycosyltransferase FtsW [Corynebacterium uropygiale]MCF4006284.1 putative lipid II flippase FtsW [Corynebacterium uropygiale]